MTTSVLDVSEARFDGVVVRSEVPVLLDFLGAIVRTMVQPSEPSRSTSINEIASEPLTGYASRIDVVTRAHRA